MHVAETQSTREIWTARWESLEHPPRNEDEWIDRLLEMRVDEFVRFFTAPRSPWRAPTASASCIRLSARRFCSSSRSCMTVRALRNTSRAPGRPTPTANRNTCLRGKRRACATREVTGRPGINDSLAVCHTRLSRNCRQHARRRASIELRLRCSAGLQRGITRVILWT